MIIPKKIIQVLHKVKLLRFFNLTTKRRVGERSFFIPIHGVTGLMHLYDWEPWILALLDFKKSDHAQVFIDVGANLGQTLLKVKSVREDICYYGIEPNTHCVSYLRELIDINKLANCHLISAGVGEDTKIEMLHFFQESTTDGSASIKKDFRGDIEPHREMEVLLLSKEVLKMLVPTVFDFIKIDIEGAELLALETFSDHIVENQAVVFIEMLPIYSEAMQSRLENTQRIFDWAHTSKYKILRIFGNQDGLVLKEVEKVVIDSDIDHVDYVMLPQDLEKSVGEGALKIEWKE